MRYLGRRYGVRCLAALRNFGELTRKAVEFPPHFPKPAAAFAGDMLYGIQTALDAPITMKKQEGRLAGHLARLGAKRIGRDTLIVMVPSDIRKLYAGKTYELQYGVMSVALPQRPDEP